MNLSGLSFDHIPSIDVPFRFYFVAALFTALLGLFISVNIEAIWLSRWSPVTLMATHILALGVLAMIMFGSLFQMLPVLCGAPIAFGRVGLLLFQLTFVAGIIALVVAFSGHISFIYALCLLAISVLSFIAILLKTLIFNASGVNTKTPMIFAVLGLLITIVLGLVLLLTNIGVVSLLNKTLTNIHALFGTFAWLLLLVVTVSFQVIPMFHVTPDFPRLSKVMPMLIFAECVMLLISVFVFDQHHIMLWLLQATVAAYAIIALKQLSKRKRKLPDATINFWQLSLSSLLIGCLALALQPMVETEGISILANQLPILIGMVFGLGFAFSVIQGLLLKIIPFLITLHLQQHAMKHPMGMGLMPDHYSLIPRSFGQRIIKWHLVMLLLLLSSAFMPALGVIAGMLLAINGGLWAYHIMAASRKYLAIHQAITAA